MRDESQPRVNGSKRERVALDADFLLRAAFYHASEAIFLADDNARYVNANAAAAELTGFSQRELCGMTVFDLTPAASEELGRTLWREFIIKGSLCGDYLLTRKDGAQVEVEFRALASIAPGCHLSVLRDVTDQRRLERERNALLAAQSRELERVLRAERLLVRATELFAETLDAERIAQQLLDFSLNELGSLCVVELSEQGQVVQELIGHRNAHKRAALQQGQRKARLDRAARLVAEPRALLWADLDEAPPASALESYPEFEFFKQLGTRTALGVPLVARATVHGALILGDDGERRYDAKDLTLAWELGRRAASAISHAQLYAAAQREIEERKRTHAALRDAEEQLRHAAKMEAVGRLSGGIAHDFNNLLTVILGYSEAALLSNDSSASVREALEQITAAAARAEKLTQQLLAFSRKQVLEPKVINVNQTVTAVTTLLSRVIGENIRTSVLRARDLWPILVDPDKLTQVLINLIVNARDAMPQGGTLSIKTENLRDNVGSVPDWVRISVTDSGTGMDEATLAHIFEPFFTTKSSGKGTGLGLATAYGIVRQSGGDLRVRSSPAQGTTFQVYLPRFSGPAPMTSLSAPVLTTLQGSESILLVEDEVAVRALIRQMLERYGYTVFEACDGLAALHLMQERGEIIALLLTDVIMPHMSGSELTSTLRAHWPNLPVVYMSGYTDNITVRQEVEIQMNFLQKPFNSTDLARKLREVLDAKPRPA